ncbi:MAG: thymidine phosphorylase [Lachnospiraceae bacterium]|nr:thymidine phosphorylase [Lachnospiraceae bacterium]
MRMVDLIRKKRDGLPLTKEEIRFFTEGYVSGVIPDYQAAALLMAIWFRGMDREETAELTFAIRDSGEKIDLSGIDGVRADKHSTGGVGDKTSLIVAPIVASCGVKVAKISGRGLGHTGGTVDKLESIPGYRTDLSEEEFIGVVNRTGIAIVGQSREVAPADKKLYALRDVTSTVDSVPLIVSSIMGKKLAVGDDVIVLDVKTGSGSFMKTEEDSRQLAEILVDIGKKAGKKIMALITDMDRPLGEYVGNALEVREAIETLKGRGPGDLREICEVLSGAILMLSGFAGTMEEGRTLAKQAVKSGAALRKLREMIEAQGGDPLVTEDYGRFGTAPVECEVPAAQDGYIAAMDTEAIGKASLLLGAGRNTMADRIDMTAGIRILKKTGDRVKKGEPVAVFYTSDRSRLDGAQAVYGQALTYSETGPAPRPLVLGTVE